MPLVRIDLRKGKDAAYRQEIGRVVYEALLSIGVPQKDRFQVINDALNSTLSRTFNTTVSTLVVVLCIFLLGGATIRSFTFAIMLGVIIGTYTTLFVATPVAYEIQRRRMAKKGVVLETVTVKKGK